MIKFFRKIRQNLLSEGKTGKYLKYAIGEIVLVMIGILLALQINNWNEVKKINANLKEALNQINQDLKQDEINLKGFENSNVKRVSYLLKLTANDHNNFAFDSILKNLDDYFYFYKSNNAYSSLKSTGMFASMENIKLKNNLTSYYEQMYERLKTVSEYGETFTNDQVIPYTLLHLDYDENMIVNEDLVKEKLVTTNLVQLAKYQINVKKFSLNLIAKAIKMNQNLRTEIENELLK